MPILSINNAGIQTIRHYVQVSRGLARGAIWEVMITYESAIKACLGKADIRHATKKFKMATEPGFVPISTVNVEVEGDITVPGAPDEDEEPSTLDEPVSETLVSHSTLTSVYV